MLGTYPRMCGADWARSVDAGSDHVPLYLDLINPQSCRYGGNLACRPMSTVLGIPSESSKESMKFLTPLSSPIHRGLQDLFEALLDTSKDTLVKEVSGDANESLDVSEMR